MLLGISYNCISDRAPSPIMWLYFDYYGYYMMTYKSTSDSYFNYFKGDPVGQNIYLLPDSNFEGGLGVFYIYKKVNINTHAETILKDLTS